jgi:F-type H+-transporting ATPase subunit b
MQIDWFTVIAQIVNFLVLVWLLKRFLYGRIVDAMKRREDAIAARMEGADRRAEEAARESEEYRRKSKELEEDRAQILKTAREETQDEREALINRMRGEVNALDRQWRSEVERERESFLGEVRRQVGLQVGAVARRVLLDLANAELERQVAEVFVTRLRELPEHDRGLLTEACRAGGEEAAIRSAFELSPEARKHIEAAVRHVLGESVRLRYETDSELICGVALMVRGRRVAWSVDSYLDDVQARMSAALIGGAEAQ